ncbi:MAG: DegT/DnrJ/EryC1/StrS family aminotransferase [Bacteroidales bacterium]|jgi:perosamine synthetase
MKNKWFPIAQPSFLGNEKSYVMDALASGWISSIGPYIDKFEKTFASYHGVKHAISTHNGTSALHLALAAAGIGDKDEVIVPDLTFIATANCVRYCNAIPILTDVSLDDWNISPEAIRRAISHRTKAIIPVHLYGNPAAMREIMEIAKQHNLFVIEDCAEALGAEYQGKKVGTFGHISCFSFFGNKIITTGEGGMCITNDDHLAERMRILRDHGMNWNKKYWYENLGYNYRMTNLQAALGVAQMEQVEKLISLRDEIYRVYHKALSPHSRIRMQELNNQRNVNWEFTIRMTGMSFDQRDAVMESLKILGIDSRPIFYPISLMSFYQDPCYSRGELNHSIAISREGISLPTYVGLTHEEINFIVVSLLGCLEKTGT